MARVPFRVLSERYGISTTAIFRHRKHVSSSLALVEAPHAISGTPSGAPSGEVDVLAEVRRLYEDCRGALDSAVSAGNVLTMSLAARETHRSLDLLARALERIEQRRGAAVIDLATLPAFVAVRVAIQRALAPFPEASLAVAETLAELEDE